MILRPHPVLNLLKEGYGPFPTPWDTYIFCSCIPFSFKGNNGLCSLSNSFCPSTHSLTLFSHLIGLLISLRIYSISGFLIFRLANQQVICNLVLYFTKYSQVLRLQYGCIWGPIILSTIIYFKFLEHTHIHIYVYIY